MDSDKLSQWSDCFPAGLRVLVVDDDPTHLQTLLNMLHNCNYQATVCNLMRGALDLLEERKDGFDIVISDADLRDMDVFQFLKHVGTRMDIPVIMMSVDGETSKVMKLVEHGACDYLVKPIRMEEIKIIWQHVVRKMIRDEPKNPTRCKKSIDRTMSGNSTKQCDEENNDVSSSGNKRKNVLDEIKNHDRESCDNRSSSGKKARVVWSEELHQKFLKVVNHIGLEKAGPKRILELMETPWLTRENVASHLQKYRLYMRKLQQENEVKATYARIKNISSHPVQAQYLPPQIKNYAIPRNESQIHNHNANRPYDGRNTEEIISMPMPAAKYSNTLFRVNSVSHYREGSTGEDRVVNLSSFIRSNKELVLDRQICDSLFDFDPEYFSYN